MAPLTTVGILSIGEMGMGFAKLLIAHNFRVVTNVEGRSPATRSRALAASIETLPSDTELVRESTYILSIVPPRDALATAQRIASALNSLAPPKVSPLYYLDLNAISPRSAVSIAELLAAGSPGIRFLDGGIIGSAPSLRSPSSSPSSPPTSSLGGDKEVWNVPSIPISGPHPLSSSPSPGPELERVLNIKHIAAEVGPASGLKCCFASLTKGLTALAIQSFSTAEALGVLPLLKAELEGRAPGIMGSVGRSVVGMPPKAYRWVGEMEEISRTHRDAVGFEGRGEGDGEGEVGVFDAVAEVYRVVAHETVLGEEKTGSRKRGRTVEDVAVCVAEGLKRRRRAKGSVE